MNTAQGKLTEAIRTYFGAVADKREPIKTNIVDQKTVGSVSSRSALMPSEVALKLKANKTNKHILHVIHRASNGVLSLHTVFPFQQVTMGTQSNLNTVNVGVITPAASSKHERTVGSNVDNKAIAFGNSNFAAFARLFASQSLNGASLSGNLTETYIPKLLKTWTKPYHTTVKHLDTNATVGQAINHITLLIWSTLKAIESDTKLVESKREEKIQQFWNEYQTVFKDWLAREYLDRSIAVYAEPNGVDPDVSAYLGINAPSDELNPSKIYSADGETSFLPEVNKGFLTAVILDDETDQDGKFKFGIYKVAAGNREELVTLEDEEEISKTVEVCTRCVQISDGAGNNLKVQVRVRDQSYGSDSKPIKLSRSFFNIPVGTPVEIRGKLQFRMVRTGSQAITAEVVANNFKVYGAQNMIIGDLTTTDSLALVDASELPESFMDMINDGNSEQLSASADQTQDQSVQNSVQPTETQTDEQM